MTEFLLDAPDLIPTKTGAHARKSQLLHEICVPVVDVDDLRKYIIITTTIIIITTITIISPSSSGASASSTGVATSSARSACATCRSRPAIENSATQKPSTQTHVRIQAARGEYSSREKNLASSQLSVLPDHRV